VTLGGGTGGVTVDAADIELKASGSVKIPSSGIGALDVPVLAMDPASPSAGYARVYMYTSGGEFELRAKLSDGTVLTMYAT
jgi:hypothetical protein